MTRHWHAPPDLRNSDTFATSVMKPSFSTVLIASISSLGKITVLFMTTALQASLLASCSVTGIKLNKLSKVLSDLFTKASG